MKNHFQNVDLRDIRDLKDASINKGKRGIKHIVFGRTGLLLGFILLQVLLLFVGLNVLAKYVYVLRACDSPAKASHKFFSVFVPAYGFFAVLFCSPILKSSFSKCTFPDCNGKEVTPCHLMHQSFSLYIISNIL